MKYILASSSPRRKELFGLITDKFEIVSPDVEETIPNLLSIKSVPEYLSSIKAGAVAKLYPEHIVVGADTVVICENEILGKPKDYDSAFNMLKKLSGKTHSVITGYTICFGGDKFSSSSETKVEFYNLKDCEINEYIKTGEPFDKAGGYGIQGFGALLVKSINGDYFNVVGLPVAELKRNIEKIKTVHQ